MAWAITTQFPPNNSKKINEYAKVQPRLGAPIKCFGVRAHCAKPHESMGWSAMDWSAPVGDGMRRVQMFLPVIARYYPAWPGRADAIGRGRLIVATSPKPAPKQRQNVPPAPSRTRWRSTCRRAIDQGRKSGAVTAGP